MTEIHTLEVHIKELENHKNFTDKLINIKEKKDYFLNCIEKEIDLNIKAKLFYGLGLSYKYEKDYPLSIQFFTKAINQLRMQEKYSDKLEAQLLIYTSLSYLHLNIPHKHEELFLEGIQILEKQSENEEIVKAYIKKCLIIFNKKDYRHQIVVYIEKILSMLRGAHFEDIASYYLRVGLFYLYGADNVMFAIVYFLKSLELSKLSNQFKIEVEARVRLSYCYKLIDHYEEVIEYLEPLIMQDSFKSINDIDKFTVAENLIISYSYLGNKEKAIQYLTFIDDLNQITNPLILIQLRAVLAWLRATVDIQFKHQDLFEVLDTIEQAKKTYFSYNGTFIYMYFDMNLAITEGTIYYELNEYKKALSCFNEALQYALNYGRQKSIATIYKHLAKCYEKEKDYVHSLQYYRLYNDIMEEWFQTHSTQYTESLHHKHDMLYKENQIHELNTLKEKLLIDKNTDRLTKLGNRYMLQDILSYHNDYQELGPYAVLMIDIDHFKAYNDYYGHVKGDDVIRQVAIAIKNSCNRPTDISIRYGGEEFLVIVSYKNLFQVEKLSERIIDNVDLLDILHDQSPFGRISVSIGVSYSKGSLKNLEALISEADKALYQSKTGGRNMYSIY